MVGQQPGQVVRREGERGGKRVRGGVKRDRQRGGEVERGWTAERKQMGSMHSTLLAFSFWMGGCKRQKGCIGHIARCLDEEMQRWLLLSGHRGLLLPVGHG